MTDADVAIAVAAVGASVVRSRFGTALLRIDKGAGDFATAADLEAEEAMRGVLRRARPDDGVLGEEGGRSGGAASARTWLLDPLCGTLNYAARMRVAAVNVALKCGNQVTAAAVADPFGGDVCWTDMTVACVRSDGRDDGLRPTADSRLVDLNLDPPFPNGATFRAAMLLMDPAFTAAFRPRVVSSSVALAWVATGQRAAYVTDGDLRDSVHFAAGLALCEGAGCVLSDLWGRSPGRGATGLIAAADPATHAALRQMVGRFLR